MKDFKFYALMWLLVHAFIFGFLAIIYFAAGDYSANNIHDLKCSLAILFIIEFLVIGFMYGAYKTSNVD